MNIDKLIAYENGELDQEQTISFFQELIDSGEAYSLQGHYGRAAERLIEAGYCHRPLPFPRLEPGLLFDGAAGYQANAKRVIDLAVEKGFDIMPTPDYSPDDLMDIEAEASEHLEAYAPAGYWVGWHQGDFGVYPLEDEE